MDKVQVSIINTVRRLLSPQMTLDPQLFDKDGQMFPQMREKLLNRADFIIQQTIAGIPGLKVADICLTGSAASYCYHKGSDIDIKIEVHNENCPFLTKDIRCLREFYGNLVSVFYNKGYKLFIGNRFVDPQISPCQIDIMGIYSILNKRWVLKPDRNATLGLNEEEIMDVYKRRYFEIEDFLAPYSDRYDKLTPAECEEIYDFFYWQVYERNRDIKDYLAYKLLNYKRKLKMLGSQSVKEMTKSLST